MRETQLSIAKEVVTEKYSPAHISKISKLHGTAEYAKDLEATMATVGPHPYWEYQPMGLAFVGREAVAAHYKILFDNVRLAPGKPYLHEWERPRSYGDNCVVVEKKVRFTLEGYDDSELVDSFFIVVVIVDDNYVVGERAYYSGPLAKAIDECFDAQFRALPGVIDLSQRRPWRDGDDRDALAG
jgi:hypothetical protein